MSDEEEPTSKQVEFRHNDDCPNTDPALGASVAKALGFPLAATQR